MTAVRWSAEALERLDEIHAHIAADAPVVADEMVGRLLARTRMLAELPYSGRRVSDYAQDDLRELLERPYRIIYAVGEGCVEIVTVKHYRQRLPDNPQQLS